MLERKDVSYFSLTYFLYHIYRLPFPLPQPSHVIKLGLAGTLISLIDRQYISPQYPDSPDNTLE
jgi:hypothetical protein